MSLLAALAYDPATAVLKSTAANLAMTAFDTTNARLTFTAPSNGAVLVRIHCGIPNPATGATVLLGVLDGATVRMRQITMGNGLVGGANADWFGAEAVAVISGLTSGNSYTWDAAYGIESPSTAGNIKYGGPDDAVGNDGFGALIFEIWSTDNLLGSVWYDPTTAVNKLGTALAAMAEIDASNLRVAFTAPASGNVMWRIRAALRRGTAPFANVLLGVIDTAGPVVRQRVVPHRGLTRDTNAQGLLCMDAQGVITGLTASGSYTFSPAWSIQVIGGATDEIRYGGPNNATADDAGGGIGFEVWKA